MNTVLNKLGFSVESVEGVGLVPAFIFISISKNKHYEETGYQAFQKLEMLCSLQCY